MTRSSLHGFATWVDFLKATLSLGLTIGGLLYAGLIFGLDSRYANKSAEAQIASVDAKLLALQISLIEGQIFASKINECPAATVQERTLHAQRVSRLQNEYSALTHRPADLPRCTSL